jgi:hypothetical protein
MRPVSFSISDWTPRDMLGLGRRLPGNYITTLIYYGPRKRRLTTNDLHIGLV